MFIVSSLSATKSSDVTLLDRNTAAEQAQGKPRPDESRAMPSSRKELRHDSAVPVSPHYHMAKFVIGRTAVALRISRMRADDRKVISGYFQIEESRDDYSATVGGLCQRLLFDLFGVNGLRFDEQISATAIAFAIAAHVVELPFVDPPPTTSYTGLARWRLTRIIAYVETHLSGRITLAALARCAGLQRRTFATQFRATTGLTPHEYVLRKRIERAQLILLKTDLTLTDVILGVGFRSRSDFATAFKRFVGRSPDQWRKETQSLRPALVADAIVIA